MRILSNEKLIKRNARIGAIASLGGLAILVVGLVVSFNRIDQIALAWAALLGGFILTQVGLYFGNRWGRRPRPDEMLDTGLKGLNDQYSIYHYNSPVSHLLLGPGTDCRTRPTGRPSRHTRLPNPQPRGRPRARPQPRPPE